MEEERGELGNTRTADERIVATERVVKRLLERVEMKKKKRKESTEKIFPSRPVDQPSLPLSLSIESFLLIESVFATPLRTLPFYITFFFFFSTGEYPRLIYRFMRLSRDPSSIIFQSVRKISSPFLVQRKKMDV